MNRIEVDPRRMAADIVKKNEEICEEISKVEKLVLKFNALFIARWGFWGTAGVVGMAVLDPRLAIALGVASTLFIASAGGLSLVECLSSGFCFNSTILHSCLPLMCLAPSLFILKNLKSLVLFQLLSTSTF